MRKVTSGKCLVPLPPPNPPPNRCPWHCTVSTHGNTQATSSNELGLLESPLEAGQVSWWQPQTRWLQTTVPPPPGCPQEKTCSHSSFGAPPTTAPPPSGPAGLTSPGAAAVENSMAAPPKIKNTIARWPSHSTSRYLPKRTESRVSRGCLDTHVHSSIIYKQWRRGSNPSVYRQRNKQA